MKLYEVIANSNPTHLLADPRGAEPIAIPCKPGNGVINRGVIMARGADGMFAPAAAADVTETAYLVVLNEAVNTNENATIAEDAAAYRAGNFIDGYVTLKDGEALTDAHKVILRKQNIVFSQMAGAKTFNNATA